jgi:hypothetical protein
MIDKYMVDGRPGTYRDAVRDLSTAVKTPAELMIWGILCHLVMECDLLDKQLPGNEETAQAYNTRRPDGPTRTP